MIKKSYSIQMTYDVSDAEKMQGEKALLHFNHAIKLLNLSADHLNIMKTPFKDNPEMSPDDVMKARAAIRRFRDKAVDNFNDFKIASFKCVNIMQGFASDTQTVKVMKSFISTVETLENSVNDLVDLFGNLKSKTFSKDVVKAIEGIQAECEEIEEIIQDRIKNHIQSNILAKSWVDSVSKDLQMKIEQKTPLILDLYNKRQEQLSGLMKEKVTGKN